MRKLTLALALLALPAAAEAQTSKPPDGLPGFILKRDGRGDIWWYRNYEGYDYMVRPSRKVWDHSPLAVVPKQELSVRFGINEAAMAQRTPKPGITAFGGPEAGKIRAAAVAQDCPDGDCPPSDEAEGGDCSFLPNHAHSLLDSLCWIRFWKQNGETVKLVGLVAFVAVAAWIAARRGR